MRPQVRVDVQSGVVERTTVLRTSACGKQAYTSKKVAKAHAKAQRRTGENVESYHCFACHCYHLGHVPGEPRRLVDLAGMVS